MEAHCQVTLNSTHIFIADSLITRSAYLLNWDDFSWTAVESLALARLIASCGLVHGESRGQEVVVAGDGTSEIFSLETLTWRTGPVLDPTSYSFSAQLQTTFLYLGGFYKGEDYIDYDSVIESIYRYNPDDHSWQLLSQQLQQDRAEAAAVGVPNDFVNCN